jgi:peptidylprolyl isomerase
MKTITPLSILALAFAVLPGTAQTAAPAKPAAATAKTAASGAKKSVTAPSCSKDLPDLSTVPTLPAGLPCAKPLYTVAPAKLSNISPLEGSDLDESLGLQSTSFTLSYIDSKVGTGPVALPKKWYSLHYTGYLPDGTVFDASSKHPESDPFNFQQGPSGPQGRRSVITGWDTGISGMRIGGKRRLFIPFQLAYGPSGSPQGGIPAKSWLIFDVELVAQSDNNPSPAAPAASGPNGRPGIPMKPVPSKTSAPTTTPATPAAAPVPPAANPAPAAAAPATTTAPAPATAPKP